MTVPSGRLVLAGFFVATGVMNALWGATLAATDSRLDLGTGRLGTTLLVLSLSALVAMPVAGRLADRWTSHRLLLISAPLAAASLVAPALAPSFPVLLCAMVPVGVLQGLLNVALTAQAAFLEHRIGRPIMATMHATWGVGAVAGGALTATALRGGADVRLVMGLGGVLLAVLTALLSVRLPAGSPVPRGPADPRGETPGPRLALLIALGLAGAAAFITEGAATDWAGVYASRVLGADAGGAALMYTIFFGAMTGVRFIGDALRGRLGAGRTIQLAGLAASTGYLLILLTPALDTAAVEVAMAGWALAGAGMALVWPIVSSTVGAAFHGRARGLSAVTTVSYGGGLIGPALIGYVAAGASLQVAMIIPAVLAVLMTIGTPAILAALARSAPSHPVPPRPEPVAAAGPQPR